MSKLSKKRKTSLEDVDTTVSYSLQEAADIVKKTGAQGSGILRSMSDANCFIVLPLNSNDTKPGDLVDVQIFHGII